MTEKYRILCINLGSTSIKIAAFDNSDSIFLKNYSQGSDYQRFEDLVVQEKYTKDLILSLLDEHDLKPEDFDVYVARGGAQVSIESGAYIINQRMYDDTNVLGTQLHPGKLAVRLCFEFSRQYGKEAYMINGPSVDEFIDVARITGLAGVFRISRIHALNQKEVAYRYARQAKKNYVSLNLIVCHIGGGISVTAHRKGKMIDSNDIVSGGPMTPNRTGDISPMSVVDLAYSGEYTKKELMSYFMREAGLIAHLGTADVKEIEQRIQTGDQYAKTVLDAMIYQIAKAIGSMAVVLEGNIDRILLTGGMARSNYILKGLKKYVSWIASMDVFPGEFEMEALAAGVMRVKNNEEQPHIYTGEPVWSGFKL